jgi:hypothetical protein
VCQIYLAPRNRDASDFVNRNSQGNAEHGLAWPGTSEVARRSLVAENASSLPSFVRAGGMTALKTATQGKMPFDCAQDKPG